MNKTEKIFKLIEEKISRYNNNFDQEFLPTSALSVVRRYNSKNLVDLEIWALFCAILNFQIDVTNRLIPMIKGLITHLEKLNLFYIDLVNIPQKAEEVLSYFKWDKNQGFSHRFIKIKDIIHINKNINIILKKYKSIGKFIEFLYDIALGEDPEFPMRYILEKFTDKLRVNLPQNFSKSAIPNFSNGSAMKRLCLYFRWMVRPYPDLKKWTFFDSKHLLPPVDSAIIRTFDRIFNIYLPKTPTFNTVIKIYKKLQKINPRDPVKYDFALSRPAIAGYCTKDSSKNQCYYCPFIYICISAQKLPYHTLPSSPLSSRKEQELFDRFLRLKKENFDEIKTEVNLGQKRVDALCHLKNNGWWIIEVENELNYTAVGQALVYKRLYEQQCGDQRAEPVIVCGKDDKDIAKVCELDAGIKVFIV